MENNFLLNDELLWDYADGLLDPVQHQLITTYLEQNQAWKVRLDAIVLEQQRFGNLPLEKPNAGFADRVMAAWALEQRVQKAMPAAPDWILRLIPVVFAILILLPLVGLLGGGVQQNIPLRNLPFELPALPIDAFHNFGASPVLFYGVLFVLVFLTLRIFEQFLQLRLQYGKR